MQRSAEEVTIAQKSCLILEVNVFCNFLLPSSSHPEFCSPDLRDLILTQLWGQEVSIVGKEFHVLFI